MLSFFAKFKNLSVAAKLFGGFSIVIIVIVISSLISMKLLSQIRRQSDQVELVMQINDDLNDARRSRLMYQMNHDENTLAENLTAVNRMSTHFAMGQQFAWVNESAQLFSLLQGILPRYIAARDAFLVDQKAITAQAAKVKAAGDPSLLATLDQAFSQASHSNEETQYYYLLQKILSDATNIVRTPDDTNRTNFAGDLAQADTLASALKNTSALQIAAVQTQLRALNDEVDAYYRSLAQAQKTSDVLAAEAENINKNTKSLVQAQSEENRAVISRVMFVMAAVALCSVLVGMLTAGIITRQMTRNIKYNLHLAERIAAGDLSPVEVSDSTDELGRLSAAMATMNTKLRELISQIKGSVSYVASASSQIAAGNIDLASRTEEQSAAVVETAASVDELTSTVKRNADNAREASQLANSAAENARSGGQIVWNVVDTMGEISESSNKIKDITSVINGISFQTNILALNAAVEAARAGEQGRGFAVVAGEVRNLAQRSAQAAREIETLIQESVIRVNSGSEMVNKAGETMKQIVSSVESVSGIMSEIAHASDEQSRGIEQISKAMGELDTTTQQNASLVHESNAAASSLEEQGRQLSQLVNYFRIDNAPAPARTVKTTEPARPAFRPALSTTAGEHWEKF